MSDSINVRVTLGSYDVVHPSQKQTQVYVQIPEVGRASWLLDASFYAALRNEPWPHVIDEAHNDYERRGVVSDSASAAARQAIVDWLLLSEGADYDARYDAVQAAWEADQARRHPVARKLLAENEKLRAQVAELNESVETAAEALREAQPEESPSGGFPPALPWLALLDEDDRVEFLDELADSATVNASSEVRLAEIERTCATYRLIAEAQHGHNTAPGPDAVTQVFAPVASLREVSSREEPHDSPLHRDYKGPGHDLDLPTTGGVQ